MKYNLPICAAMALALTVAVPLARSARPAVTIDYKTHVELWRAQRAVVSACQHIDKALDDKMAVSARHAHKAQELLVEASGELQLAAAPDRK